MNPSGFWWHVGLALLLSVIGAVAFSGLAMLMGNAIGLRLVIAFLTAVYLLAILRNSEAKVGRLLVGSGWLLATTLLVIFNPGLDFWLAAQLLTIWLVRSLYLYQHLWQSAADALLNAMALVLAIGALWHTDSLFLSLWCFFLIQTLFLWIQKRSKPVSELADNRNFERAFQTAELALKRLSASKLKQK